MLSSRLVAALLLLALFTPVLSAAPPRVAPPADEQNAAGLQPLPGGCGGGLPAGVVACCISGYVLLEGQPVAGAKVTITGPNGSMELWSDLRTEDGAPYYRADLALPPLDIEPGDALTITARFGDREVTVSHTAQADGQQIDLVLPRTGPEDYAFAGEIWEQGEPRRLTYPTGVAVGPDGTLFVADTGNSRVQAFTRAGDFLRAWGTQGDRPGELAGPAGLAVTPDGELIVADAFNYRIQLLSSTGVPLRRWGERGAADGQMRGVFGVAQAPDGTIYAADTFNHRIQLFDADGAHIASWGAQGSAGGQFETPVGVAVDAAGNLYVADRGNNRIQKLGPTGAHLASWGTEGSADGQLSLPEGVALDAAGNLYVTDWNNNRVQVFGPDGGFLRAWGSFGDGQDQFRGPRGIAVDAAAELVYVVDTENNRVQQFDLAGNYLTTIARATTVDGQLTAPIGVAVDGAGRIYTTEWQRNRVQIFEADGALVRSFGEAGGGPGQFNQPIGVAVDPAGTIYVADTGNRRIQKFNPGGGFVAAWDSVVVPPAIRIPLGAPAGVATDEAGNVYFTDFALNAVVVLTPAGLLVDYWGSPGIPGSGPGQFNGPAGIAIDGDGFVYVVDSGNDRVQKFTADGQFVLEWGGPGNGIGQFNGPNGIAVDADNNVYVTESGPLFITGDPEVHRIQKFTSAGAPLSAWGSAGGGPGQFVSPVGVAVDAAGEVLVADSRNNRVQRFRRMGSADPIATIVSVDRPLPVVGEPVQLRGRGSHSDAGGGAFTYSWTLVPATGAPIPLGTDASLTVETAGLELGIYTLELRVTDGAGRVSAPATRQIEVRAQTNDAKTWTFLLYLDADVTPGGTTTGDLRPFLDNIGPNGALFRLINGRLNANVAVLAQYDGPGANDTARYVLTPGGQVTQTSIPEANMGQAQTLVSFADWGYGQAQAIWAAEGRPADYLYLSIADHANAMAGIAWDFTSDPTGGERLTNSELRRALLRIETNLGRPIDVLHLDGCLMGLLEVAYQLKDTAGYLVASENLAWSAFAYDRYRSAIGRDTPPEDFAAAIVDSYAGVVEAEQLPYTIAAFDLAQIDPIADAVDALSDSLRVYALASPANRAQLAALRAATPPLDSNGNLALDPADEYVDLLDWLQRLGAAVADPQIQALAADVADAIELALVDERHDSGSFETAVIDLSHANGLGIYYPQRPGQPVYEIYGADRFRFAGEVGWGAFLAAAVDTQPYDEEDTPPGLVPPLPLGIEPQLNQRIALPMLFR